ncbi:MAG: PIN domain-containing protein [bacterium]
MTVRVLFVLGFLVLGGAVAATHQFVAAIAGLSSWGASALVGALLGAVVAGILLLAWHRLARVVRDPAFATRFQNSLLCGAAGTALGLTFSFAIGRLFPPSDGVDVAQGCLVGGLALLTLGAGFSAASPLWQRSAPDEDRRKSKSRRQAQGTSKVLDTSVIIDGRVGDLMTTGFIEGEILIPEFVLDELQGIADSADALRRKKGRRGLEILRQLMDNDHVAIRVVARDYPSIAEVDRKLIRLAKEENAILITTDYNLNRVAQVEGIGILNINELANAVKPRFVPGEPIDVEIIDRGAEINQGVGYLDDGTMIVIENGRRHIGRTIRATVKSTLQTDAGRMLFAEPANEAPRWDKEREAR